MNHKKETSFPQFPRILVATDFSLASERAFLISIRLAGVFHAHLLLLHVFEYADAGSRNTGGIPEGLVAFRHSAQRTLDELRQRAKQYGLEVETPMDDGGVSAGILEALNEKQIDVVVMGANATSGLERFVFGSTAEEVFRKAQCPVLTVGPHVLTPEPAPHAAGPVIFAADLDSVSVQAVRYAAYLSERAGTALHCLHVRPQFSLGDSSEEVVAKTTIAALQWMINESGLIIENPVCAITYGNDVPGGVVDYGKRNKAGFIVFGVRRASITAHLPAHITYRIIAEANCPVLTVAIDSEAPNHSRRSTKVTPIEYSVHTSDNEA